MQTALEPEPAEAETPSPLARAVPPETPPARLIGEAMHTYILVEKGDTLILIDKHAAHERINFDRLLGEGARGPARGRMRGECAVIVRKWVAMARSRRGEGTPPYIRLKSSA